LIQNSPTMIPPPRKEEIVFVIADLQSGGTQRVVSILANYWSQNSKKVTVITLSGPETDFFKLSAEVNRISLGGQTDSSSLISGLTANLQRIRLLRRELQKLQARYAIGLISHTNILLTLAGLGLETRIIISERNDPRRQSLGLVWNFLRRFIYPLADLVTANSREVVAALRAFVPEYKLAYLPNPIAEFNLPAQDSPDSRLIIAVGRLHYQKAHDILISAFAKVASRYSDWRLEILGEGSERDILQGQIDDLGMNGKITLTGRVTNVAEHLAKASIFALPSRFEGTPNALLEAMSVGVAPVISDTTAGALEYVEDQENGLIIPVEDVDGLANAFFQLIENDTIRRDFAKRSIAKVQHLSLPEVARIWQATIDKVP
jgi:GalNAc-alpha-(1->4)-GalNAc-alpha-(1->3)-diNAcBac-PP-undecaprenol alpha-1,4-N-acetyl-D-galactosaminyltransferase